MIYIAKCKSEPMKDRRSQTLMLYTCIFVLNCNMGDSSGQSIVVYTSWKLYHISV